METRQQHLKRKRGDQESPKEEDHQKTLTFTCEICTETKSSNTRFNNNDRCVHPFCATCIENHIKAKVEDNIADIECPNLDCHQPLDPLACSKIIALQLFDKWSDILCDAALKGFERCYCPYGDCAELIVDECGGGKVRKTECPNCKKMICFSCKLPWHACHEDGDVKDENDVLFRELAKKKKWTKCPGCNVHVERTHGCNHIRCRCGTPFCYNCGKDFTKKGDCTCK